MVGTTHGGGGASTVVVSSMSVVRGPFGAIGSNGRSMMMMTGGRRQLDCNAMMMGVDGNTQQARQKDELTPSQPTTTAVWPQQLHSAALSLHRSSVRPNWSMSGCALVALVPSGDGAVYNGRRFVNRRLSVTLSPVA
uniref:Uncharacterized protein n=1 Tax=Plectus sambesii TaxID=2011161 RepID=A0A914US39_9BILA